MQTHLVTTSRYGLPICMNGRNSVYGHPCAVVVSITAADTAASPMDVAVTVTTPVAPSAATTGTATLPPDAVAAAQERGRALDLEATVAELLVELESQIHSRA
jgi:hypothetical protein